jgi:hypothetical protein
MMRYIALLVTLAVCLAGCGQKPSAEEEKAVSQILKVGGGVNRDEKLPGRPIVEVDLSITKATDSDLKDLKELKGLKRLYLGGTQITDAGLKDLKELKGLRELHLGGPQITEDGVKELRQALPTTDIYGP